MRLENIYKRIVKGESLWRECKEYLENINYTNIFMGLSKFLKRTNWSKNTAKKYLRLALKGRISFMTAYCLPQEKDNGFPLELSSMIAERYRLECEDRAKLTKGKKNKINFKTFYERRNNEYQINGNIYKPKLTYIQNAIKFHGLYSRLCTHKTKQTARFQKTFIQEKIKRKEKILRQIGMDAYVDLAVYNVKEIQESAPSLLLEYKPGQRWEIDASKEMWGMEEWTVYTIIDSSTGFKVSEVHEKEETNLGYLRLLSKEFEKYGKPLEIVTDERRVQDKKSVAQLRDFIIPLGTKHFSLSDPNAKPKVERYFLVMENVFYFEGLRERNAYSLKKLKNIKMK